MAQNGQQPGPDNKSTATNEDLHYQQGLREKSPTKPKGKPISLDDITLADVEEEEQQLELLRRSEHARLEMLAIKRKLRADAYEDEQMARKYEEAALWYHLRHSLLSFISSNIIDTLTFIREIYIMLLLVIGDVILFYFLDISLRNIKVLPDALNWLYIGLQFVSLTAIISFFLTSSILKMMRNKKYFDEERKRKDDAE